MFASALNAAAPPPASIIDSRVVLNQGKVWQIWAMMGDPIALDPATAKFVVSTLPRRANDAGVQLATYTGSQLTVDSTRHKVTFTPNDTIKRYARGEGVSLTYSDGVQTSAPRITLAYSPTHTVAQELLINPGPRRRSGVTLAVVKSGTSVVNGFSTLGSSLADTQADDDVRRNVCTQALPAQKPDGVSGAIAAASDGSCPTFTVDTRVGWTAREANKNPGWEIRELPRRGTSDLVREYRDSALSAARPCELREIGQVYSRVTASDGKWTSTPYTHFRDYDSSGQPYRLMDFRKLEGSFEVAVDGTRASASACKPGGTSVVLADIRVQFVAPDSRSNSVVTPPTYIMGVVLWDRDASKKPFVAGQPDYVFFKNSSTSPTQISVFGERLSRIGIGLSDVAAASTNPSLKTRYSIDYKELLSELMTAPPGFNIGEAVIVGFDLYASVRGANLSIVTKGQSLKGYR